MSMSISLGGLNAAQTDISTTSNNIANVGSTGFRKSRTEFSDEFYADPMKDTKKTVGAGVTIQRVAAQFSQGNLQTTGNLLDLAIGGQGFFAVAPAEGFETGNSEVTYTRAGAFGLNKDGRVVNGAGQALMSFPVAADGSTRSGTTESLQPVDVPQVMGQPRATETVELDLRLPSDSAMLNQQDAVPPTNPFDAADPTTWATRTPVPLTDENGAPVEGEAYFIKTVEPSAGSTTTVYDMRILVDGVEVPANGGFGTATLSFDELGQFIPGSGPLNFQDNSTNLNFDVSGSVMRDDTFQVLRSEHDGQVPAGLNSLQVDSSGTIWAAYGGDDPIALGRVAVANFTNPQGLRPLGGATYGYANDAGETNLGVAGMGGMGLIRSGSLERSNVDLTEELVNLITAQRNYQANAKALETSASLMQTVMNIRG
ncbi:flagellar hook protein FlgE [Pelagovum sp. HNIBRBA483]|uniref:flagellar hook protein FlgE n=1 Tax=Pelagovum sp. HNIBRBA483 TaxID=3233341 RepID=UPI0034A1A2C3